MMGSRRGFAQTQVVRQQDFTQRLEQRRVADAKVNELHRFKQNNLRYDAVARSDDRVELARRQARQAQQQEELENLRQIEQQAREQESLAVLREQDEQMAAALHDLKVQKQAEEGNARRICEESEELKELKEKLRAAKISKVRATQLEERKLLEKQRHTQDRQMDELMETKRQEDIAADAAKAERQFFENLQRRGHLRNQIAERQVAKREAYEAFLREKAMVDEIVRGIEEEDRYKMQANIEKQKYLQENIRQFLREREQWREEEKKRAQEELRKIQEYNAAVQLRFEEAQIRKKAEMDGQVAVLAKITRELEAKRLEEEEYQNLLDELYHEEAEQKQIERLRSDKAKRDKMNQDIKEANEDARRLKQKLREEQDEEDRKFREHMMEKFAADKRLEQMNDERRRREMRNYRQEVERLVQIRRDEYDAAVRADAEFEREKAEQEKYRLAVVERERQRLLRDHAEDLQEFLPKGVLQTTKDYEVVYGRAPRADEDRETAEYIRGRNARSTINLGSNESRNARAQAADAARALANEGKRSMYETRPASRTSSAADWWGDGSQQPSRAPSAGRRS